MPSAPGSLEQALEALEADHQFLLKGDVFTKDVIETHLSYKRSRELDEMRLRPHPHEFFLYHDVCAMPALGAAKLSGQNCAQPWLDPAWFGDGTAGAADSRPIPDFP